MEIGVITLGNNNVWQYSQYAFDINRSYCEKHGYTYIQYNDVLDHSRPAAWSKILAVKRHINQFDWIMWIDADAIFFNHDTRIQERIDESVNFIAGKACGDSWIDAKSPDFVNVNTGCFLIRGKCDWSYSLMDQIYSRTECIDHKWWENQALSNIIRENNPAINSKIKILDQHLINGFENRMYSYFDFSLEQFIMHYAGLSFDDRLFCLKLRHDEFKNGKFCGEEKANRTMFV
jgi:hypothetical protein